MPVREGIYGLLAEFDTPTELVVAAKTAYDSGWRRLDCYTPYPLEEAAEAIGFHRNYVPLICLVGGLMGLAAMFLFETWVAVFAYPLNIAGRPLFSWPAFIIPPTPYHPLFNAPNFRNGATTDKFFLCLEANDPKFEVVESRTFLESFKPVSVVEVEY
jgi:hypothetical protein